MTLLRVLASVLGAALFGMQFIIAAQQSTTETTTTAPAMLRGHSRLEPQVTISGGSYEMGSDNIDHLSTGEFPIKHIDVKPFKIDRYPVTNGDFMMFKKDKPRYKTEAETWGYSWVLYNHKTPQALYDSSTLHPSGAHWYAVRNATWEHPYGEGSSVLTRMKHPVVHVSYHDAYAFCVWANKRLPTEYDWEYAARAGINGNKYPWGNDSDVKRSNLWQGPFPQNNAMKDGYDGLSAVDAFKFQNNYGMFDMIGNVWEWTSTVFTVPRKTEDPAKPRYTAKGGSFIDSYDGKINQAVRNSARVGLSPYYSAENLGFRCAESPNPYTTAPEATTVTTRRPVRHRLKDTWEYKVKKAVQGVINVHSLGKESKLTDEL